ncbi:MAG: nucleoside monophosphate kinase [Puniceicoccales bacterium]|nr:nucleoside monophosphate kinase [Puniceicoccales bacterium]
MMCSIEAIGDVGLADEKILPVENVKSPLEKHREMKESEIIAMDLFDDIWGGLCSRFGEKNLHFPKQVVFLNGAPGAGKGTNTLTVMRVLEIPSRPVEVSSLLKTPECEALKDKGMLISDDIVVLKVVEELLKPENARGVIIDGFPRTAVQAYFLRQLIRALRSKDGQNDVIFRMVNFSVSRKTSVERQLARGTEAIERNKTAKVEGRSEIAVRATDISSESAMRRYEIYEKSIRDCIVILRNDLDFCEINAEGTFEDVKNRTYNILLKQKSLDSIGD